MHKSFFVILLSLSLFLLSSCTEGTGPANPDGERAMAGGVPDDWVTVGKDYPYERLENIRPFKVPEIKAGIGMEADRGKLGRIDDGFVFLAMSLPLEGAEESELIKPIAWKYDKTGKLVWVKEYEYGTKTGFISNLLACHDGFLFTVQTYPQYVNDAVTYEKSLIIRCDNQGKTLWEHELDDYSGNMVKNAVLAENEEIWLVGTGRMKNGVQMKEGVPDTEAATSDFIGPISSLEPWDVADSIAVTRLDSNGNLLEQKWFGGSDFDEVYSADYKTTPGLILWGSSQSHDGDFAIDEDRSRNDFIACINSKLELQWVFHAGMNSGIDTAPFVLENGEVCILGSIHETGSKPKGLLIKLDKEGKPIWEKKAYDGYWGRSVTRAENGDILIAKGYGDSGMIAVVDCDGNEKKLLDDLKFYPGMICPVKSGGFIVTATRNIDYVPQLPIISSIWYDTELIAVKYGTDYEIEWRKTYDHYKNKRGTDVVWPQPDGSLVIPVFEPWKQNLGPTPG